MFVVRSSIRLRIRVQLLVVVFGDTRQPMNKAAVGHCRLDCKRTSQVQKSSQTHPFLDFKKNESLNTYKYKRSSRSGNVTEVNQMIEVTDLIEGAADFKTNTTKRKSVSSPFFWCTICTQKSRGYATDTPVKVGRSRILSKRKKKSVSVNRDCFLREELVHSHSTTHEQFWVVVRIMCGSRRNCTWDWLKLSSTLSTAVSTARSLRSECWKVGQLPRAIKLSILRIFSFFFLILISAVVFCTPVFLLFLYDFGKVVNRGLS
jgi:hypothetical protein